MNTLIDLFTSKKKVEKTPPSLDKIEQEELAFIDINTPSKRNSQEDLESFYMGLEVFNRLAKFNKCDIDIKISDNFNTRIFSSTKIQALFSKTRYLNEVFDKINVRFRKFEMVFQKSRIVVKIRTTDIEKMDDDLKNCINEVSLRFNQSIEFKRYKNSLVIHAVIDPNALYVTVNGPHKGTYAIN